MINFCVKPDQMLTDLIEETIDWFLDTADEDDDGDLSCWYFLPEQNCKALGGHAGVRRVLEDLKEKNRSDTVYMPSDYIFLVLYYLLDYATDIYNDEVNAHGNEPRLKYKGKPVTSIDFDCIVDSFFWDLDFLMGSEILSMPKKMRELYDISQSAVNASSGLMADTVDFSYDIPETPAWFTDGVEDDGTETYDCLWLGEVPVFES